MLHIVSANCGNPADQVNDLVKVFGFKEPAVRSIVTYSCPLGLKLTGPNSSTCMGSGEWEPYPGNVTCTGKKLMNA